jgi:hypothetical protein
MKKMPFGVYRAGRRFAARLRIDGIDEYLGSGFPTAEAASEFVQQLVKRYPNRLQRRRGTIWESSPGHWIVRAPTKDRKMTVVATQ